MDDARGARIVAAGALKDALAAGWAGFELAERAPLDDIATAHERVEARRGRILVLLDSRLRPRLSRMSTPRVLRHDAALGSRA